MMRLSQRASAMLLAMLLAACAGGYTKDKQITTLSDQTQSQNRATIRMQLAVGYFSQRQLEVALDEVKLALQAEPELAEGYGLRGLIYMEMKETALADDSFKYALKLAPNNPDLNNNYGWFLCKNRREAEAMTHFDAALKVSSYASPEKALNNAGLCALNWKKLELAEDYFRRAFLINPSLAPTNSNFARLYYEKHDYQRAEFYFSRVAKTVQSDELPADVLWLGIRLKRKLGDKGAEDALATQLRRHHAGSSEYMAWQRGAFDE